MARKTKEEAEKTYMALLEAAATLFTRQGVANTTLNQIAAEAGVTRGALYWHFDGKDQVIRALWETFALPKIKPFKEALDSFDPASGLEGYRKIIHDMMSLAFADRHLGQAIRIVMLNVESTDEKSDLQLFLISEFEDFIRRQKKAFDQLGQHIPFRTGITSDTAATGLVCLFTGMMDNHFKPNISLDLTHTANDLLAAYLKGVFAES